MRATMDRDGLLAVLTPATRPVEKKATIPVLRNVRLNIEGDTITVRGTDLDCEVIETGTVTNAMDGTSCVPGHLLLDIVRKIDPGTDIEVHGDNGGIRIRAGAARFNLFGLQDGYPELDPNQGDRWWRFEIPTADLIGLLEGVGFSASTEETRYYLCGVYLHVRDDRLMACATDGHKLALASADLPEGTEDMEGIILPSKAIDTLIRNLGKAEPDSKVKVALSDRVVQFEHGTSTLTTKVIDGNYPDYERVIPRGNPIEVRVLGRDLKDAVGRAAVIGQSMGKQISLAFGSDSIEVGARSQGGSGSSDDTGQDVIDATVPSEMEGVRYAFNSAYLLAILDHVRSDEVTVRFVDPENGSASPILEVTGALRRVSAQAEATRAVVATAPLVYAAIHQAGGQAGRGGKVSIPARPYLGFGDDDVRDIVDLAEEMVLGGL